MEELVKKFHFPKIANVSTQNLSVPKQVTLPAPKTFFLENFFFYVELSIKVKLSLELITDNNGDTLKGSFSHIN